MIDDQQAITWATTYLKNKGYYLYSAFIPVRIMPWSSVYSISTSEGLIFLKQITPPFAIEATLLPYLTQLFPTLLPKIIEVNQNLLCFLMADGGTPLREHLRTHYQVELANKGIVDYTTIQQDSVHRIHMLLTLGVPDWRLTHLSTLYIELLNKSAFLIDDGLSQAEIEQLKHLHSHVTKLCHQLSKYHIPETIEHGDFHDNNMLIDIHSNILINDWGDAVITHPFFSLASFLWSASRNHPDCDGKIWSILQDNYLNCWLKYETKSKLRKAWELAKRLNYIKFSLSFYRITQCPDMENAGEYKGTITEALRTFLHTEA